MSTNPKPSEERNEQESAGSSEGPAVPPPENSEVRSSAGPAEAETDTEKDASARKESHSGSDLEELMSNMQGKISASIRPTTEPPSSSDAPFVLSSQHPPTKKESIKIVEETLRALRQPPKKKDSKQEAPAPEPGAEPDSDPDPDPEAA